MKKDGINLESAASAPAMAAGILFQSETKSFPATATNTAVKNWNQAANESCDEFITTRPAVLRYNQGNDRGKAGLDRLAGSIVSQIFCATRCTNLIRPPATTMPMENQGQKAVRFPHRPTTDLR